MFGFPLYYLFKNELHIITPEDDQVLETQVAQRYIILDGIFTEPHTILIAIHSCLVGHFHCVSIALKSRFRC